LMQLALVQHLLHHTLHVHREQGHGGAESARNPELSHLGLIKSYGAYLHRSDQIRSIQFTFYRHYNFNILIL
jgi:hypothetical protein